MIRSLTSEQKEQLIEELAALEHEQWMQWSKNVAEYDRLAVNPSFRTIERMERWKTLWVSYEELTEEQKERDRAWARKVLRIFKELNMEIVSK